MKINQFDPLDRLKPSYYKGVTEMEELLLSEDKLYEDAVVTFNIAQDGQYVQTMSLPFIVGMEGLLNITALSSETLEFRRSRILNRLNTRPPFNLQFLKDKLDNIYGPGNYTLSVGNQDIRGQANLTRYSISKEGSPMTIEPQEDSKFIGRMYLGDTSKTYKGWQMANGEFLKTYPNPNELQNSASPKMAGYLGAEVITTENIEVPEWGATDAVRHQVTPDTGTNVIVGTLRTNQSVTKDVFYVHSIYVKNIGTTRLRINNNLGLTLDIQPGESKRVEFPARSSTTGSNSKQFVLYRDTLDSPLDFILWHAKIEVAKQINDLATPWVPRLVDDYHNAVPLYSGSTDKLSNNPKDYNLGINTNRSDFMALSIDPNYYTWLPIQAEYTIILESASLNKDWYREGYITIMSLKPANLEYIHRPLLFDNVVVTETLEKALGERFKVGVSRVGIDPLITIGEYQEVNLHDPNES